MGPFQLQPEDNCSDLKLCEGFDLVSSISTIMALTASAYTEAPVHWWESWMDLGFDWHMS